MDIFFSLLQVHFTMCLMKKKIIIITSVFLVVAISATLVFTNMFTKGIFSGKLYRVENVYEEIWNLVNSEKHGTKTVLTTKTADTYVDYDSGEFVGISIPELNMFLTIQDNELQITFSKNEYGEKLEYEKYIVYVYDHKENILYGNRPESHLIERFVSEYLLWTDDSTDYAIDNLGKYTFVHEEYPLSHD